MTRAEDMTDDEMYAYGLADGEGDAAEGKPKRHAQHGDGEASYWVGYREGYKAEKLQQRLASPENTT